MKLTAVQKFTLLDYPGKVACIAFTPGCDLRCGFCHNAEFVLPERLKKIAGSFIDEEYFFAFLERRRGLLEGVVVSGGEPTVWRDLPAFLERIHSLGFSIKLDTNGNNPTMLRDLLARKLVDFVAMDVKTSLEEYSGLVGRGVRPEHIAESIELIHVSGIEHEFRTTLIKEHHSEAVLVALDQLLSGSSRIAFQRFRPEQTLSPTFAFFHPFSSDEMHSIRERFQTSKRQVVIRE